MTVMRVSRRFSFDAAHFLPDYEGKCANLHGHTWFVEPTFEGDVNPETGMVIDFSLVKTLVGPIIDRLDHTVLNSLVGVADCKEILPNPTAENIAIWICEQIVRVMPSWTPPLVSVKVWESPESYAEICING